MSQHDLNVANQSRTNFRQDLNNALEAIASQQSGPGDPAIIYSFQEKIDTSVSPAVVYIRNAANTTWVRIGYINASTGQLIHDDATDADTLDGTHLADILLKAGGNMSGALNEAKGTDIVAAATTDIGAATGNVVDITHASGTLAITAFGTVQAGARRKGRFVISGGTLSITNNATSMILNNGGSNITLANGDRFDAISLGSGNWFVTITKADGTALSGLQSLIAFYENLAIGNNGTNPNYQLDITADKIQFTNGMVVSSFSKTVDITASGANGLDTGSEAGTVWYHIWAIAKTDGTNASLLSLSAIAPTMPSGYTLKTYLGAVFNNASSNFLSMKQTNKSVVCEISNALSAGTATSSTAVDLTTFIPATAKKVCGNASHSIASMRWFIISPTNLNTGRLWWRVNAADSLGVGSPFICPIITAQTIYYCVESTGNCTIEISGWEF